MPIAFHVPVVQTTKPTAIAPVTAHIHNNIEYQLNSAYLEPLLVKHNAGKGGVTYDDLISSWKAVVEYAAKISAAQTSAVASIGNENRNGKALEAIKVSLLSLNPSRLFFLKPAHCSLFFTFKKMFFNDPNKRPKFYKCIKNN